MQRGDENLLSLACAERAGGIEEGTLACLGNEIHSLLFEVIEPTLRIRDREEFVEWMQTELQRVFPHEGMMCGIGSVGKEGVHVRHLVGHNVPQEYLHALQREDGQISSPVLRRWIRERQPILFDPHSWAAEDAVENVWIENLQRFGLSNMAAHGQSEIDGRNGSYFSFSGIPGPLTSHHAHLLKLLVPHMHNTLVRIFSASPASEGGAAAQSMPITAREKEILEWMGTGKTNGEIGRQLKISEATVKNHVHHILERLKVRTRTEAVAKAMDLKLITGRIALLLCANAGLLLQVMEFLTEDCNCFA